MSLPAGWYPGSAEAIRARIERFGLTVGRPPRPVVGGIVPHAGWDFSGALAAQVVASLARGLQTVVIVGGHLRRGDPVRAAREEGFETPLGVVRADSVLLSEVVSTLEVVDDGDVDNTVEVQLPLVRHFLPEVQVLSFRAPPSDQAVRLGEAIDAAARRLGRVVAVIGSTDLTHYGPSYRFTSHGTGEQAVRWVREVNDRRFLEAVLAMDAGRAVSLALAERSACSSGAAAAAIAFSRRQGVRAGELLGYGSSLATLPGSTSFVGYAAVSFSASAAGGRCRR